MSVMDAWNLVVSMAQNCHATALQHRQCVEAAELVARELKSREAKTVIPPDVVREKK